MNLKERFNNSAKKKWSTLIRLLLIDRTTMKNIIWGTDSYKHLGTEYEPKREIKNELLKDNLIVPRSKKASKEQKERTKDKAEVFTPTWVVDDMVAEVDKEFEELPLIEYIRLDWIEITAGEAPYMVSRYDTVTGEPIVIKDRVGFLDRKLQRISKEIDNHDQWVWYAKQAYKASYGYDFQGDSLLLARENLLLTFIDYYENKFEKEPTFEHIKEVARIISYNVFQMDGLKHIIPLSDEVYTDFPINVLEEYKLLEKETRELTKVKIRNWKQNRFVDFEDIGKERGGKIEMKFDVVIGNPPYQEENEQNKRDKPIYNDFMDASYEVSKISILITPGRFLFNAGQTPKKWNEKMLSDRHIKVVNYESDSSKVFKNTDIKGGIAVTYRNKDVEGEAIDVFVPHNELVSILSKVDLSSPEMRLDEVMYNSSSYKITQKMIDDYPHLKELQKRGAGHFVKSNFFKLFPEVFTNEKSDNKYEYIQLYGRNGSEGRVYKWVRKDYIDGPENFDRWKVFLPQANGSGALGEVLSTPLIGKPLIGHTQTFISIGSFERKEEAEASMKYIKTKFARVLLGVLKVTQNNAPTTFSKIPLQDFTSESDIDWTQSIADIDQQLYKKYGLNEEEINFIETHVKEME